jgi:hypothetical protein
MEFDARHQGAAGFANASALDHVTAVMNWALAIHLGKLKEARLIMDPNNDKSQTSPHYSRDFEVSDPPKKSVNPRTYPRFSWDFKGMDPPAKSSHWTANPGNREV